MSPTVIHGTTVEAFVHLAKHKKQKPHWFAQFGHYVKVLRNTFLQFCILTASQLPEIYYYLYYYYKYF